MCGRRWQAMAAGPDDLTSFWRSPAFAPTCRSCLRVVDSWFPAAETPAGVHLLAAVVAEQLGLRHRHPGRAPRGHPPRNPQGASIGRLPVGHARRGRTAGRVVGRRLPGHRSRRLEHSPQLRHPTDRAGRRDSGSGQCRAATRSDRLADVGRGHLSRTSRSGTVVASGPRSGATPASPCRDRRLDAERHSGVHRERFEQVSISVRLRDSEVMVMVTPWFRGSSRVAVVA
jgi:hypothetical protein